MTGRVRWRRAVCIAAIMSLGCQLVAGCRGGEKAETAPPPAVARDPMGPVVRVDNVLPHDINDAGVAAKLIAVMPPVSSFAARQEIELQGALLRTGVDAVRAEHAGLILIQPPEASIPQRVRLDDRELLLRVLAELAACDGSIAWNATDGSATASTRSQCVLSMRIVGRSPETAVVEADLTARFPTGEGWRQRLTATWDGLDWIVKTAGLRLSW